MSRLQEAFDKAVKGIIDQGCRAVSEEGSCVYRGNNGTACAVGQLITDEQLEKYQVDNFGPAGDLPRELVREIAGCSERALGLLSSLQRAHDRGVDGVVGFVKGFKQRAIQVAEQFGLDPKVAA